MRSINKHLLLSLVVLSAVFGLVGITSAVTNGQLDGDRHPYVGVVEFDLGGGQALSCSGSLLAPRVFLTAAHCAFAFGTPIGAKVSFDSEITVGSNWVQAASWELDPNFCLGCGPGLPGFDTHDLAVVILGADVKDKGFAALPPIGIVDALPMNTEVEIVGYGAVGRSRGNPPHDYLEWGLARHFAPSLLIQSNNAQSDEFLKLTANPAQGKGGICMGDSGGPALLGNIVLGITCYGAGSNCAGVAYSNRIDLQYALDFINQFMP